MSRPSLVALLLAAASVAAAADSKPTASVLDLRVAGLSSDEAEILGDTVREAVVHAGKYRVQDRAAMREILAQQQFNQTELCDDTCGVEQGRVLQVRYLVSSSARKVAGETWLSVRLTDVESGEVVGTAQGSSAGGVKELVGLASQLSRKALGLPAEEQPAPGASTAPAGGGRFWTWIALGTGTAALGAGAGLGLWSSSILGDDQTTRSAAGAVQHSLTQAEAGRADSLALGANVLFGVAGTLAVGAAVAWFLEGQP